MTWHDDPAQDENSASVHVNLLVASGVMSLSAPVAGRQASAGLEVNASACERGHVRQYRHATTSSGHAWLFDLLFARSPVTTWAVAGALPAGFERADQFAVLSSGGRSFMVSLANRKGASSALTSYNALRPGRTRFARQVLGLGLRTGLAQPLLRDKIDIGTAGGAASAQPDDLLGAHLRQLFGQGPVVVAFGGSTGPYRKPVLQVFSISGVPLGYVKIGWNDWTRQAVRREAAALRACAGHSMRLGVPELLGLSTWRGLDLLATAPLPRHVRRVRAGTALPTATLLREISELSPGYVGALADSPWWAGVGSRIRAKAFDPAARAVLTGAAERIERSYGGVQLAFGAWHGDLVPWNLARLRRQLYAWDWESSTTDVPLGFDALHFHFQVAFVARGLALGQAVPLAAANAATALDGLGVGAEVRSLLAALHLVELFLRHEEARSSSGDVDGRFYPAITTVLAQAVVPQSSLAGPEAVGRVA